MFKEKPLKKQHSDSRLTIDVLHNNIIRSMNEDEENEYFLKNGLLLDKYYSNEEYPPLQQRNKIVFLISFKIRQLLKKNQNPRKRSWINI